MTLTASLAPATQLPTQVAGLRSVDPSLVDRMRHEALTVPTDWMVEYGEYQNGGWYTLSLINDTGEPRDTKIRDCDAPVPTRLLRQMPAVAEVLRDLGLRYMWARLARLTAGSFLWEHRDYGELSEVDRCRLHLPLVTNSSAYLVLGGTKVHMTAGRLWRLTPTAPHGVCNLYGPDRIHLMIDCYADDALRALVSDAMLEPSDAPWLPEPAPGELDEHVGTARGLAELGYEKAAEATLLELFYRYRLPEGQVYDLICGMYAALGREEDSAIWQTKKRTMLGLA